MATVAAKLAANTRTVLRRLHRKHALASYKAAALRVLPPPPPPPVDSAAVTRLVPTSYTCNYCGVWLPLPQPPVFDMVLATVPSGCKGAGAPPLVPDFDGTGPHTFLSAEPTETLPHAALSAGFTGPTVLSPVIAPSPCCKGAGVPPRCPILTALGLTHCAPTSPMFHQQLSRTTPLSYTRPAR